MGKHRLILERLDINREVMSEFVVWDMGDKVKGVWRQKYAGDKTYTWERVHALDWLAGQLDRGLYARIKDGEEHLDYWKEEMEKFGVKPPKEVSVNDG